MATQTRVGPAISGAISDLTSPTLLGLVAASVGIAVVLLGGAVWAAMTYGVPLIPASLVAGNGFALAMTQALSGIAIVLVAILLWLPISSLIAGLFLDVAADRVDARAFPTQAKGNPPALLRVFPVSLGFAAKALAFNILALPLIFFPLINVAGFVVLNGWLMGREYFTIAAMRIADDDTVAALKRQHGSAIFLAGLALAAMFVVPVLNLAAPLFGIALMVRLSRSLAAGNEAGQ